MIFNNYDDLTSHLVEAVITALPKRPEISADAGYSNVSCSAYVSVTFWEIDEDGDQFDTFGGCKVRFSDHGDRYGSDLSIRFDSALDNDELGAVELADWRIDEMVSEAVAFVVDEMKEQQDD